MGTYILLVNSTDQGAKGVREIPNRQQSSREIGREDVDAVDRPGRGSDHDPEFGARTSHGRPAMTRS